jgi:hypothetical protein
MYKLALAAVVIVASGMFAAPAFAVTMTERTVTARYAGTFDLLTDDIGVFGPAGDRYSNQPFSLKAVFDTEDYSSSGSGGISHSDQVIGGYAELIVNHIAYLFDPGSRDDSTLDVFHDGPVHLLQLSATDPSGSSISATVESFGPASTIPLYILDSGAMLCDEAPTTCTGTVAILSAGLVTQGNFTASAVTTTVTPVPAALPLFASALGMLGFLRRRSQRRVA